MSGTEPGVSAGDTPSSALPNPLETHTNDSQTNSATLAEKDLGKVAITTTVVAEKAGTSATEGFHMESTVVSPQDSQAQSSVAVTNEDDAKPTAVEPAIPPKRGRGRPRKYPKPQVGNSNSGTVPSAAAVGTADATSTSIPAKRGRGRPPKSPVAEGAQKPKPKRSDSPPAKRLLLMHPLDAAVLIPARRQVMQRVSYEPDFEPTYKRKVPNKPSTMKSKSTGKAKRPRGRPRKVPVEGGEQIVSVRKRKRGRPPKQPDATTDLEASARSFTPGDLDASPLAKKKRGRPPKQPVAPSDPETCAERSASGDLEANPPPKKKRGRPPKQPISRTTLEASAVSSTGVQAATIKKKRGRPPKQPQTLTTLEASTVSSTGVQAAAVKKKRGRPPKQPAEAKKKLGRPPKQPTTANVKKKRGRPPKQPVLSHEPVNSQDTLDNGHHQSTPGGVAGESPVKRKRGRPRKNPPVPPTASIEEIPASVSDPALASTALPVAATAQSQAASNSPAKKKRGRPPKQPVQTEEPAEADPFSAPQSPQATLSPSLHVKLDEADVNYHHVSVADLGDAFPSFSSPHEAHVPLFGSHELDDEANAPIIGVSM